MAADANDLRHGFFISCVSRELHGETLPGAPVWVGSYRAAIAKHLGRCGLLTVFQEHFTQSGTSTLAKLDTYIARECKAVIHLMGKSTGAYPKPDELTEFLNLHPDLLVNKPGLRTELVKANFSSLSYTQWEAVLALHHAIHLILYAIDDSAPRAPNFVPDPVQIESQQQHRVRLAASGRHADSIRTVDELLKELGTVLYREYSANGSAQPVIQNLPHPLLGSLFKGREEFLKQIAASLERTTTAITAAHAIYGAGGIGKTRTAIEYAWQNKDRYEAMLFLVAESPEGVDEQLRNLAGVLGVAPADANDDRRMNSVMDWLFTHPRWLLIVDNVDTEDARERIQQRLAKLSHGHVLITSRLKDWAGDVEALSLDLLDLEQAVELLLDDTNSHRRHASDDSVAVREVAQALGRLSLGLTQARSFVSVKRKTYREYLDRYRASDNSVIGWFDPKICQYPREIAVAWKTSVEQLSPPARFLMEILAWFGPENIPESLLYEVPDDLVERIPEARELLLQLNALSLAEMDDKEPPTFWIHRLIQDSTRRLQDEESPDTTPAALIAAGRWLTYVLRGDPRRIENRTRFALFLFHAITVADFARDRKRFESLLYSECSLVALNQGLASAEELGQRAFNCRKAELGENHLDTLASAFNLAWILIDKADLEGAEPICRLALKGFEDQSGPNSRDTLMSVGQLACLMFAKDKLDDAERLARRSFDGFEKYFSPADENALTSANILAVAVQAKGKTEEAEFLFRRALAGQERVLDRDHPDTLISASNLAKLLQAKGALAEAEPLSRRAFEGRERVLGPTHRDTLYSLNQLAGLMREKGDLVTAENLYRKALEGRRRALGPNHPDTNLTASELANLLQVKGDLIGAQSILQRAEARPPTG